MAKLLWWWRATLNQLVRTKISDHRNQTHNTIYRKKTGASLALLVKFRCPPSMRCSPQCLHGWNFSGLVKWLIIFTLLIKIQCVYRISLSLVQVVSNFEIPSLCKEEHWIKLDTPTKYGTRYDPLRAGRIPHSHRNRWYAKTHPSVHRLLNNTYPKFQIQ